jgi:hypothetical protein
MLVVSAACGEQLVIGNGFVDASMDGAVITPDAGSDAAFAAGDANAGLDAGLIDAAALDASGPILTAVSRALGPAGRWVSGENMSGTVPNLQLAFSPSVEGAEGMFLAYCAGGCSASDAIKDAGFFSGRSPGGARPAETFSGRYTLYYINPMGTVFGVLYTDDGLTIDLQIEWNNRPSTQPLDQIFIAFLPLARVPLQRVGF